MADERLRTLARSVDTDPQGAARLLLERVRSGQLERVNLELAAYAGHEPSRLAAGEECSCGLTGTVVGPTDLARGTAGVVCLDKNLHAWAKGLARWGHKAEAIAACAAARVRLPEWASRFGWRFGPDGRSVTIAEAPCGDAGCCPPLYKGPCNHPQRSQPRRAIEETEEWAWERTDRPIDELPTPATCDGQHQHRPWWGLRLIAHPEARHRQDAVRAIRRAASWDPDNETSDDLYHEAEIRLAMQVALALWALR